MPYPPFVGKSQWIRSGARTHNVMAISHALRQLHKDAIDHYRLLLGDALFSKVVHVTGQLHVWESEQKSPLDMLADRLRAEHGIVVRDMKGDEIFDIVPGMDRRVRRAQLYEHNGYIANPYQLVQRLKEIFLASGGELLRQKVVGLSRQGSGAGYRIITACSDLAAPKLLVCAGAWSGRLLKGLGIDVPLETERGYHVAFDREALDIPLPVLHKERAFGVTPMVDNIRVAGFVEIAGLDAAPDMRREAVLVSHAKRLFPSLDTSCASSFWLGFRPSTPDSLPVLGSVDKMPGLYLGFGHGHTGITGAPASAGILADLITGASPKLDIKPYDINRF
ncbi:NAD(P)/FAD-dependent oxidoreductase [Paracandidimonas lactea]|uniref:NAD(P)/FAD-dependent oxidoreductase n=1 Tax=Paracandidimonas lactea TaxID=2895524 RepID=UPI001F3D524B|nr:FAD-binding oxidoreductase [Paracandidimonas lactea]